MNKTSKLATLKNLVALALLGGVVTGCAVSQGRTLSEIQAPADEAPLMTLAAQGVQIYECRAEQGKAAAWAFVAPDAELFDAGGRRIGHHGAGPHWEHEDGSRIVGAVRARVDASRPADTPWLLLATRAQEPQGAQAVQARQGAFTRVSSV